MKTYQPEPTRHPNLFRIVDRDGDWKHYAYVKNPPAPENLSWETIQGAVFLRGITSILDRSYPKGRGFEEFLLKVNAEERDRILSGAGERGDIVHRIINTLLSGDGKVAFNKSTAVYSRENKTERVLTNDEWGCLLSFAAFWEKHKPILYASELPCFSLMHGIAGTADLVMELGKECEDKKCVCHNELVKGLIGVWDIKTSSGIRDSYECQEAAYAACQNVRDHIPSDRLVRYIGTLRIGTLHKNGGYEAKISGLSEPWARFLATKAIDDRNYKPFDPQVEVVEIPDDVMLEVVRHVDKPVEKVDKLEKPKKSRVRAIKKKKQDAKT